MNRTTYSYLLKSFFALFILLAANKSFADQFIAVENGYFSSPNTWINNRVPTGLSQGDKVYIPDGITVTVTADFNITNLIIETGGQLIVTAPNAIITITENLIMNDKTASTIDFGTGNVTFIVGDSLIGAVNSTIKLHPANGKTQKLILKGRFNTLHNFINTPASDGYSIVSYEGADQIVFPSSNYSTLLIGGTGTKTLTAQNFNAGTITTISKKLELKGNLKLGALDLIYKGTNESLVYNDGTNVTGWIYTDGTGVMKNSGAENIRTFPVGDTKNIQAIQISNFPISNSVFDVRIGTNNSSNDTIPYNGSGVWYVSSSQDQNFTVTLLNPIGSASSDKKPKIALFNSVWRTQPTTYPTANSYASLITATAGAINSLSLFTCSDFTLSSTAAANGLPENPYYQTLQVNDGRIFYSLLNMSSNPAGFTGSLTKGGQLILSNPSPTDAIYKLTFTIRDTLRCETPFSLTVQKSVTIWNGTKWSNGEPSTYLEAVFAGSYTLLSGKIEAKKITVNSGATVTISDNSTLISSDSIKNYGTILTSCTSTIMYYSFVGNKPANPVIKLSTFTYGLVNQPFSQTIQSNIPTPGPEVAMFFIDSENTLPPGLTFQNTGELSGTPTTKGTYTFSVDYKYGNCSFNQQFTLPIIEPSSPNLYITPIAAKTYGDADFKLSAYTKNTETPILYSISPTTCAQFVQGSTNTIHISCAGPVPNNSITVTASQAAAGIYKEELVTTTFFINKAGAKLSIKNTGFLPNATGAFVTKKKSDGVLTFTQLTGRDLATVTTDGQVTTFGSTGTFSVSVTVDATDNYTGFDSIYVFTIYTTKQAPVAVNDTLVIQMGKDTTFNITLNDYGITDPINSTLTDIDLENTGIQKKFYSTSLGTFIIDPSGNITINPFEGFIGTDKIAYTVTDEAGLTSQIAYLQITVGEPFKLPALKGNEVMTLNNDGLNDALVIANTNIESANNLVITDEVGNIIFEQDNYRNDWKGTNKKGNNIGAGVYFYVFTEKNTGRMLQNYLQIAGY